MSFLRFLYTITLLDRMTEMDTPLVTAFRVAGGVLVVYVFGYVVITSLFN